ncbi:hypothetical protein PRUB_a2927 [Pseudoalteromonas rubra]|uniref:Glycosyltransferase 2-like domain-containing protein n=1 Tax=Pseudoalteromonas rubra TaxID=43658 RepID=A0A8T0CDZ8_9GAMM|nr:glycosyltransferase [Pseudoalteromonas rubra]KAF7788302.1 hypothetical protein PRUB_a2927 [Pseudoalteromonas rubra]
MSNKIAVLMSVYKADRLEFLKLSVESILNQTCQDFHFYIAVDGPVSEQVKAYLEDVSLNTQVSIRFYDDNRGLASRLNLLLEEVCRENYRYIARMDADDISEPERFTKQLSYIEKFNVDVLGTDVTEIDELGQFKQYKSMTAKHVEIKDKIVRRCPVNHPTVMIKANWFREKGFRYDDSLMNTQDYELWLRLMKAGAVFSNVNESLLQFRVDKNFFKRRNIKKVFNEVRFKYLAYVEFSKRISDLIFIGAFFILRVSPKFIQKIAYKRLR